MSVNWNDLQYFLAVNHAGSVRKAAERLKCSHTTVSRRLEALEYSLNARLFDRTPDGFVLTDAGAAIVAKAAQIEAEVLNLQRSVSGTDIRLEGPIRLTLPPPLAQHLVLPIVARFCELYPAIDVEIVATYAVSDLSRHEADVAIRFSSKPADHLVGWQLPPFLESVYASQSYVDRLTSGSSISPHWIGWSNEPEFNRRIASTLFADVSVRHSFPDFALQAAAAREGLGITLLPCFIGDYDPNLVRVPGADLHDLPPAWVLTHPDLRKMERVRVFSQYLFDGIRREKSRLDGTSNIEKMASK